MEHITTVFIADSTEEFCTNLTAALAQAGGFHVCGTAYAETATQCPICGSAKASANQTEAGAEQGTQPTAGYTYVKGGRFSKSNVRKRNKKAKTAERRSAPDRQPQKNANDDKANKWLTAGHRRCDHLHCRADPGTFCRPRQ